MKTAILACLMILSTAPSLEAISPPHDLEAYDCESATTDAEIVEFCGCPETDDGVLDYACGTGEE